MRISVRKILKYFDTLGRSLQAEGLVKLLLLVRSRSVIKFSLKELIGFF